MKDCKLLRKCRGEHRGDQFFLLEKNTLSFLSRAPGGLAAASSLFFYSALDKNESIELSLHENAANCDAQDATTAAASATFRCIARSSSARSTTDQQRCLFFRSSVPGRHGYFTLPDYSKS